MAEINAKNFTENLYRFNDLYNDMQKQIEDKASQINSAKENLEKIKEESTVVDNIEKLKQKEEKLKNSILKSINTTDERKKEKNTEKEKKNLSDLTQQYSDIQQELKNLYVQNNIRESDDLENIKLNFLRRIEYFNNILRVLEREKNELDEKNRYEVRSKANEINNYIDNFDSAIAMKNNLDGITLGIKQGRKINNQDNIKDILTYFYINSTNNKNNKTVVEKFLEIADRLSNDKSKDELVKECVMYSILVYNQSVEKEEQNMNKLKEFFKKNGFDIEKFKNNNQNLNADLQHELDGLKEICNNLNNGLGKTAYNPKELNYFN